ncbi:hemagglutinin repeat-containing protein [Pseudomonas palleroniana]|uniref:hemagglutinin repeat-containing protein n=1 Tax=Pseudomonas palleroniana TaxID=191390 RepID=UPI001FD1BDDF|nr:hemagglutinin repeat-containing protein [Pseudomonas palleroniana]UOP11928.1 hemagglutinin repeat-containing protein [Pseudomonas palleroniana]
MPNDTPTFHLSPQGKLRWAIASLFLLPQLVLAGGVIVAEGPGGTPQLQNQGGVPIVNIVAPNAGGLSHNQFLDYNVDRQGLVLNNALQAGQSQLAGQLAANPQFQGQAASVILNEVISRNASNLNGAQEIFGHAADYVLANPNGISVNGGSFINTPNANLVVGHPELNDGKLQALSTRDAHGQLTVHGQGLQNREGSINLIAPRIDSDGRLSARDQLNLTVGRNQVDFASGQVRQVDPAGKAQDQRIDASLFGAMQAGRINIISTAEGAGVRVGAVQVQGRDGVKISSAGDLDISGQVHANSLDATRAGVQSHQGDVDVQATRDLSLAAADVGGRNVKLDAGRNLTLSSLESRKLQQKREQWNNSNFLFTYETYDRTTTDNDSRQHGNNVVAQQDVALSSGATTQINASHVNAGADLRVNSGADLQVNAATETHETTDQGKHRKHLWTANWDKSTREQRSVTSNLKAGKALELNSQQTLQLQGAELKTPGDIQLAARHVAITSASRTQSSSDNAYSGDLVGGSFFGQNGDGNQGKTLNTASQVNADGRLIVKADDVRISGSQARGGKQASVISDKGSLVIDGVQNTSHDNRYSNDSKFFGISKDESRKNLKDSTVVASHLRSDSNLKLQSAKDIEVSGSKVSAAAELQADAKGDIKIASAENTAHDTTDTHARGFAAYAKETAPGTRQYRAGVNYADQQQTRKTDTTRQQASSLSGDSLVVTAGGDVSIKGSDLKATDGDATLSGKNVELLATDDTVHSDTDKTTLGGGVYYTGGLDRAGNGAQFSHQSSHDTRSTTTAQTSSLAATGKLTVNAGNTLTSQGAQVKAGSELQVNAGQVDNQAAYNSQTSTHKENGWTADIGANLEYRGLTRPIEKAVEGVAQAKFHQPGLLDALEQPNVGLDVEVGHTHKSGTQQDSTAVVSQFSGSAVQVNVAGKLQDEGTQYQATQGALKIQADEHVATAATDTHSNSEQGVDAKVGVRVYTTTGEDLNVRGSGSGGSSDVRESRSTAVVGSYVATQGVNIEAKGDARYAGSQFDGGQAGVNLKTGGELALNQANDSQSTASNSLRGSGSLTVGTAPGTSGTNVNLGAGVQLDHKQLDTQDSQARVATIQGNGPIQLSSAGDMTLQGTRIGSSTDKTGDISLSAGGKLDLQAATHTHLSHGNNLGGGLTVGAGKTSSAESSSTTGSLSANFNLGKVAENDSGVSVGQLHSNGNVALHSGADATDAIHLQGTQVTAASVNLTAQNGGILQESAQSTQAHNSWGVTLGAGGSGGTTTLADAGEHDTPKTQHGINARAKVDVDHLQGTTQHNSLVKAANVVIDSAGDTRLAGARIEADQVSGNVGGDLIVESRKDQVNSTQVNVDAKLDVEKNQPGVVNKLAKATGPLKDKVQAKAEGAFDKHREKLENAVDKGVDHLASAKDSVVNAKERLAEKLTRSGSYDVNPEPRGAFGTRVDQAKAYLADKKDALGTRLSSFKDKVWPKTSDSYTVSGKNTTGSSVADTTQNVLFGDKSGNTNYTPTLNLDVSHVVKDSVAQASGILGTHGVSLQVNGDTRLTGSRISAQNGMVDLGWSTVTATTLAGSDYRADLGLNLSKSPVNLLLGAKDELTQKQDDATRKDQAFNLGPLRVGGHSDSQALQAGIDQGIN